jgi:hypothetical protein
MMRAIQLEELLQTVSNGTGSTTLAADPSSLSGENAELLCMRLAMMMHQPPSLGPMAEMLHHSLLAAQGQQQAWPLQSFPAASSQAYPGMDPYSEPLTQSAPNVALLGEDSALDWISEPLLIRGMLPQQPFLMHHGSDPVQQRPQLLNPPSGSSQGGLLAPLQQQQQQQQQQASLTSHFPRPAAHLLHFARGLSDLPPSRGVLSTNSLSHAANPANPPNMAHNDRSAVASLGALTPSPGFLLHPTAPPPQLPPSPFGPTDFLLNRRSIDGPPFDPASNSNKGDAPRRLSGDRMSSASANK